MRESIVRTFLHQCACVLKSFVELASFDFVTRQKSSGTYSPRFERERLLVGGIRALISRGAAARIDSIEIVSMSQRFPRGRIIWIERDCPLQHCDGIFIWNAVVRNRYTSQIQIVGGAICGCAAGFE